jgi:hypothetical protein
MKRRRQKTKRKANGAQPDGDGWILFKRWLFCGIGFFFAATPVYWVSERDREWSLGMTIMCVLGAGFFALGMFGSRRLVDEADIAI